MKTVAELQKEQVDNLDLSINVTMRIAQWKHIHKELSDSQANQWTASKAEFIAAIRETIEAMTSKLEKEYHTKE